MEKKNPILALKFVGTVAATEKNAAAEKKCSSKEKTQQLTYIFFCLIFLISVIFGWLTEATAVTKNNKSDIALN